MAWIAIPPLEMFLKEIVEDYLKKAEDKMVFKRLNFNLFVKCIRTLDKQNWLTFQLSASQSMYFAYTLYESVHWLLAEFVQSVFSFSHSQS
jgi:hypothetical protein